MDLPRSIRTFNPGAMNYGPFAQRHGAIGTDGRLAIFPDEATGFKAMGALLDVYGRRGQNTVASIIGGLPDKPNLAWAPRGVDNNSTDTYIQKVASKLGISPNAPVPPDMREPLMRAMAEYEAGVPLGSVPRPSQPVQPVQSAQGATMTPQAPQLPAYTGATPNDVGTQRKMAQALMMQGMSTEPVGHWTQALARVLQGASGGMHQAEARKGEQQGNASLAQSLSGTPSPAGLTVNPWTRDIGKSLFLAQAKQQMDPNAALNRQILEAKLKNMQAGGDRPMSLKEWDSFSRMSPEQKQEYLTMKRTQNWKDTGTEFVLPGAADPTSRVAAFQKDIAGKETQQQLGDARGKFIASYPQTAMAIESLNAKKDIVQTEIASAKQKLNSMTTGLVGSAMKMVPGTQAFELKEHIKTILANVGFEELQQMRAESPTGGALGQVAVQELTYLQAVRGSLEQARSADDLKKVLERLEKFQSNAVERRQRAVDTAIRQLGLTRDAAGVVGVPAPAPAMDKSQGRLPQPGMVEDGFRFKGGDPSKPENWEPVR